MKIVLNLSLLNVEIVLILLLFSSDLFTLSNALAKTNKTLQLSELNNFHLGEAGDAIQRLGNLKKQIENEMQFSKDYASKAYLLRKYATGQKEIVKKLQNNYSDIENTDIQEFYIIIIEGLNELAEFNLVGAALLEARETNDTDAIAALAATIITKEAKHLAMPVVSRIALENRINTFVERDEYLRRKFIRDVRRQMDKLEAKGL